MGANLLTLCNDMPGHDGKGWLIILLSKIESLFRNKKEPSYLVTILLFDKFGIVVP